MRIGTNELLIILAVALLIFGPKNLPKDSDDSEEKAEKKAAKKDEDEE